MWVYGTTIKNISSGKSKKKQIDVLGHLILREIPSNYKLKFGLIYLGLDRRQLNESEVQQPEKCNPLDPERAKKGTTRNIFSVDDNSYLKVFM